ETAEVGAGGERDGPGHRESPFRFFGCGFRHRGCFATGQRALYEPSLARPRAGRLTQAPKKGDVLMSATDRVVEIICDQLTLDPSQVTPDSSFLEDLGADSLDIVQLI